MTRSATPPSNGPVREVVVALYRGDLWFQLPAASFRALEEAFPAIRFTRLVDEREFARALPAADVLLAWSLNPAWLEAAPRLRWVQLAADGMERRLHPALVASDVLVTNSRGVRSADVAEHAMACLLALSRELPRARDSQRQSVWAKSDLDRRLADRTPLRDRTLLVVGLGEIGRRVTALAAAWGVRVIGVSRTGAPIPHAERTVATEELDSVVPGVDAVVVAAPDTAKTRGMWNRERLARLKRGAWFVNVSRGALVDSRALDDLVAGGHIAGAALDVFETEPLPPTDPLWSNRGVMITPHVSAGGERLMERIAELFGRNLTRYVAHRPLINIVDKELGY